MACADADVVAKAATPATEIVCIMKTRRLVVLFIRVLWTKLEKMGQKILAHAILAKVTPQPLIDIKVGVL
jgi:hypothetical protein